MKSEWQDTEYFVGCSWRTKIRMYPSTIINFLIGQCRNGDGCLYTVVQRKTSTSVLQCEISANRTVEEDVLTVHNTMLAVLPRENAWVHKKRPYHLPQVLCFSVHCNLRSMRSMETISTQYYMAFDGLFLHYHIVQVDWVQVDCLCQWLNEKHHQLKLQLVTTTTCASGMFAPVDPPY